MKPISFEHKQSQCVVSLAGEIDIASASELKQILVEALASRKELRVSLQLVTDLDVTAWQLLWAAAHETHGRGTGFTLFGTVPEAIFQLSRDCGFESFPFPVERQ